MASQSNVSSIVVEVDREWATIWLNTPSNRNALTASLIAELTSTLEALKAQFTVRGITLRGKGGIFCAGGDLKGFRSTLQEPDFARERLIQASRTAASLFALVDTMPQTVAVFVEGPAMAGGFGLACCADIVIAKADASFALTETMIGISPAQIAPYVVRRIGPAASRRLMLTAARLDAEEGRHVGLVDFIVANESEFCALDSVIRRDVRRCAPKANAATKMLIAEARAPDSETFAARAAGVFADCLLGSEGREGISAFLEKRAPTWADGT